MARLQDKVAFITGAGSGIGRSAAGLFAAEGAKVAIVDIAAEAGRETLAQVQDAGGEAIFLETDVTDPESVEAAIRQTVEAFDKLDVLYNNAGGSTQADGTAVEAPLEEFWRAIKLDLFGTFLGCRFGIPELIKAGGGSVVNMTSNVSLMGIPGRDCYTAAKGGVAAITRSLAVAYAPDNVRVNAIAPATTRTPRVLKILEQDDTVANITAGQLMGINEPIDVAYAALYLASEESRRTTGAIMLVDSGTTIS